MVVGQELAVAGSPVALSGRRDQQPPQLVGAAASPTIDRGCERRELSTL